MGGVNRFTFIYHITLYYHYKLYYHQKHAISAKQNGTL